jgi:hypothetical protein
MQLGPVAPLFGRLHYLRSLGKAIQSFDRPTEHDATLTAGVVLYVCHEIGRLSAFHGIANYRMSKVSKYFFDIVSGEGTAHRDVHGQDFASLEGAKTHAARIARELAQDGSQLVGCSVCIVDEQKKECARVSIDTGDG